MKKNHLIIYLFMHVAVFRFHPLAWTKDESDPSFLLSTPAPWQRNKSKMADDKLLWFEKVGCKCQDFICVRRSMIVMNFCGEPETERNRVWRAVCASSTSQSLQSLSDFICTVLSFPLASLPCRIVSCLQSIILIQAFFPAWPMIIHPSKSLSNPHFRQSMCDRKTLKGL